MANRLPDWSPFGTWKMGPIVWTSRLPRGLSNFGLPLVTPLVSSQLLFASTAVLSTFVYCVAITHVTHLCWTVGPPIDEVQSAISVHSDMAKLGNLPRLKFAQKELAVLRRSQVALGMRRTRLKAVPCHLQAFWFRTRLC